MSDFYCDEALSGRTPVDVEFEDEFVLAFRHTRPAYEEHVVVVPKEHVDDLLAASPALLGRLLAVVQGEARRMVERTGACRVISNVGAYQDSKHLHWHVVSGKRIAK